MKTMSKSVLFYVTQFGTYENITIQTNEILYGYPVPQESEHRLNNTEENCVEYISSAWSKNATVCVENDCHFERPGDFHLYISIYI